MGGKGDYLENEIKKLFEILLKELGYTIHKNRKQNAGTQDGFDNEIIIIDKYYRRYQLYIECKDYTTKLSYSEAVVKIPQIISSYDPDILIFLSPKKPFSNPYNDTRIKDFYNQFKTPIEFLTPDNQVEELFALVPNIYKSIYGSLPDFDIDRRQILQRFDRFIHSTKPLQKIVLNEKDKLIYINDISMPEDYIERYTSKPTTDSKERYFRQSTYENTFLGVTSSLLASKEKSNGGVVLLGNPGMGKSTELKRIALHYWEHREVLGWIPFFREIKNFTESNEVVDFLPKNWKEIPQLLMILDGLDEIHHSQSFRSKLEKFITDSKTNKNEIKFILSCRTNIYESVIRDITSFEVYILDEISLYKAVEFLEQKACLLPKDKNYLHYRYTHKEFLENPYYLHIFALYYSKYQKLPTNKSELLDTFIKKRLDDDRIKFKNKSFDESPIVSVCKRLALTMEAMQVNEVSISQLNLLLQDQKNSFTDSSFSMKVYQKEFWKFEHRNLQEYFAASALASLDFDTIIGFIQLDDDTKKIHPSWIHTVSYLLSILEEISSKFQQLISWLQTNDPEVLLKADTDRIPKETRLSIFKAYFVQRCKIETLWIGNYSNETIDLAHFASYEESIDFLIKEAIDFTNHRRTRISAIDLIAHMHIVSKKEAVKLLAHHLLKAPIDQIDLPFKATVINELGKQYFFQDSIFIKEVISILGDIDFHQITKTVLHLISKVDADDFFGYIKNVSTKVVDENKRIYKKTDNLNVDEEGILEDIFIAFKKGDHAIFALDFYLGNSNFGSGSRKETLNKILDTLIIAISKDDAIVIQIANILFEHTNNGYIDHQLEPLIFSIFEKTNTKDKVFNSLYIPDSSFSSQIRFLTYFTTKKSISAIIDDFISEKLTPKNITQFRNNLSHEDMPLALVFESEIETKTNFQFEEKLSIVERKAWSDHHITKTQESFNLLFKKEDLLQLTDDYFSLVGEDVVTWDNNREYRQDFYHNLELQSKYYNSFMTIVHTALQYADGRIVKKNVKQLITDDLFILSQIKGKLTDRIIHFEIRNDHIAYIKKWCFENIPFADYKALIGETTQVNTLRCELIWFFKQRFDFQYPTEFLLDMLLIDGKIEFNGKYVGYDYIIKAVSKKAIDARIIFNLKNEKLSLLILSNHISYSINNQLTEVYPIIEDYFRGYSNEKHYRRSSNLFYDYTEKVVNIPFLKELVAPHPNDPHKDGLSWDAIRVLIFNGEAKFAINKLLAFRKSNISHENLLIVIKYLILANYEKAFLYLNNWLSKATDPEKQMRSTISTQEYLHHKNIKSIPYLIEVFKTGHNDIWDTYRMQYHPRKIAQDTLKNICENEGALVCKSVIRLLETTKIELENMAIDVFYINDLIRGIRSLYYKHKSNPMGFAVVCHKIETFRYIIL